MADRVLTAEMILSGKDAGVSDMLARICTNIDKVSKQASHTAEVQKLGQSLASLDKQMAAIDRMATAQNGLTMMNERALTAAAGVDKLKTEMAGAAAPAAAMTKALAAAEAASTKATASALRQAEAVSKAEHAVAAMSLPTDHAAVTQERLAKAFGDTARAAEVAVTAERRAAEASKVAAAAELQHHKALERRAEIASHHGVVNYGVQVAAGALAAHSIVHGEMDVAKAGAEIEHERVRLRALGKAITEEQARAIEKQALDLAVKFPLLTQHQLMHTSRNAVAITGSAEEAMAVADPLARLRVIADAQHPGQDSEEDFDALVKGLEIKGVTQHPEQFLSYMNGIAKGLNAFGDTVKPSQYYDMFKYGRQATPRLSEDFILSTAPALAQELGGSSYGKAVSGFNSAVVSGVMKHTAGKEFANLGLVEDKDLDKMKGTGEIKGLLPGHSLKGAALAQSDPYQWIRTYLLPALAKKGITDEDGISKEIGRLFQNSTTAQLVSILATQGTKIEKDRAIQKGAKGLESASDYATKDPFAAFNGLKNSLETFAGVLTSPIMADATKGLSSLSGLIGVASEHLAAFEKDHPDGAKALAVGAGAAGLAVAGTASAAALTGFGLPAAADKLMVAAELQQRAAEAEIASHGGGMPGGGDKPGGKGGPGGLLGKLGSIFTVTALAEWAGTNGMLPSFPALSNRGALNFLDPNLGELFLGPEKPDDAARADRDARIAHTERQRLMAHPLEESLQRMREEMIGENAPVPPTRPVGAQSTPFSMIPADAGDRMREHEDAIQELGRQERESVFTLGALDRQTGVLQASFTTLDTGTSSAAQQIALLGLAARTVAGAMAGMLANGAAGGSGSGVINASYGGEGFGGGFGLGGGSGGGGGGGRQSGGSGGSYRSRGGSGGGGGSSAPGAQTLMAGEAYRFWRSKGLDHEHAIGMVVQEQAENNFSNTPGDYVRGQPTAFSPFQFHGDRAKLIKQGTGIDVTDPNLSHADALRAAYFDATKGGRAGYLDRYMKQSSGLDGSSDYATRFYEGPKELAKDQATRRGYAHMWDKRGFPGAEVAAAVSPSGLPALPKGGYWAKDSKGNPVAVGPDGAAIPSLSPPVATEHPALAAPALKPRGPASHEPPAHITTARLEEKMERMAQAVERGGLHRFHVALDKGLSGKKTYQRGSVGSTIA